MGLRKWVQDKWVDIANKRKDGSYPPCGRSKGEKRKKYPKCVPIAKARSMSKGQRRSAVARKQKASNTGPKPSNVRTLARDGGYMGSYISGDLGGVKVSNASLRRYYKGMV